MKVIMEAKRLVKTGEAESKYGQLSLSRLILNEAGKDVAYVEITILEDGVKMSTCLVPFNELEKVLKVV